MTKTPPMKSPQFVLRADSAFNLAYHFSKEEEKIGKKTKKITRKLTLVEKESV